MTAEMHRLRAIASVSVEEGGRDVTRWLLEMHRLRAIACVGEGTGGVWERGRRGLGEGTGGVWGICIRSPVHSIVCGDAVFNRARNSLSLD